MLTEKQQVKREIDKFFKRLKRNAGKTKWLVQPGSKFADIRSIADGNCPLSFLANVAVGGDFNCGSFENAAQALGLGREAANAIANASDIATAPHRKRLLKAVGL